jgi:PKHD-type hydroxylase
MLAAITQTLRSRDTRAAVTHLLKGRYKAAARECYALVDTGRSVPNAICLLSIIAVSLGLWKEARAHLEICLRDPTAAASHLCAMAYVCIGLGDLDAAQRCVRQASGNRRLGSLSDLLQARVWQEAGDLKEAERLLRTLVERTPSANVAQQGLYSCARDRLWTECSPVDLQCWSRGRFVLLDEGWGEIVVCLPDLLSRAYLRSLRSALSAANWESGRVGLGRGIQHRHRRSRVTWLQDPRRPRTLWLTLFATSQAVNRSYFGQSLVGAEAVQVALYAPAASAFEWHADRLADGRLRARSLTMVVALSDSSAYAGGVLEFRTRSGHVRSKRLDAGEAVFFPSNLQHRVSPITAGQRMSMTVWFQEKLAASNL